jgi:hypothetical protein
MQYVTVLSPAFSGSTLLSLMLTAHPRATGFGDTYFGPKNDPKDLCTCGRSFLECEARLYVQDYVRRGGVKKFSWDVAAPVPRPKFWPIAKERYWPITSSSTLSLIRRIPPSVRRAIFGTFYRENSLILQALDELGDYDFYFDGSKFANRLELLRTEIPDIKLIHLVRHPGAILYHDQRANISRVEYRMAQWERYHRRARSFIALLGESSYLPVPYESVVQRPEQFLNRVGHFLGIGDWPTDDPSVIDRSKVHIMGNAMRESVERIVDYSNTWRQKLPANEVARADNKFLEKQWAIELYESWNCDLEMPAK